MVGGPANIRDEPLQPTVGYSVAFGALHGYIEAYGEGAGALAARFEIVADPNAEPILEDDVLPQIAAGGTRAIFSKMMPVRQLPPGKYLLRATLFSVESTVKVVTRPFEVAAPAVLMTSASEPGADATANEVYLPVPDALLSQAFNRADASKAAVVRMFRDKVPAAARSAFDHGVQAFADGSYLEAETALKSAINPDEDSSAILAYLAAVYAASGHDTEAAGAWQTALIDGSDVPEVYEWLAGSLLRSRDMTTARAMLEEAADKWPTDPRFSRPIALVYATFGMGPQAFRSLERYLTDHRDDADSLFMGVEWLYQLHAAGVSVHSPADDAKLAKTYADAYAKAKGQKTALVKQWIDALETKTR
jgi:Flp pilus assembly protein TadD